MYCPDCKIEVESGEYCPLCGRKLVRDSHSTGTVVDDSFSGEAAQVSGKKTLQIQFQQTALRCVCIAVDFEPCDAVVSSECEICFGKCC